MDDNAYYDLAVKIDGGPLRAPRVGDDFSKAFMDYLALLYLPDEAEIVQHLEMPLKLKPASEVAEVSGRGESEVRDILDSLAKRGLLMGFGDAYSLPTIAFLLNIRALKPEIEPGDLEAARLYQKFFIEDGFYRYYESSEKGTPIMRVIPVGEGVENGQRILESEEAHAIIDACSDVSLVPCPCRSRTQKMATRECKDNNPVGFCIMVGISVPYFDMMGLGKKVTAQQAKDYFDEMLGLGLVGMTENYEDPRHSVICLCCGCCCSIVRGRTRWDNADAFAPSNFVARASEDCILCGDCAERCLFDAISIDENEGRAVVDADECAGCGVCAAACNQEAMRLVRLERAQAFPGPKELYSTVARENREG